MKQRWYLQDDPENVVDGDRVRAIIVERLSKGSMETWFHENRGGLLNFITNGDRAMLMFLKNPDDPGEHLTDPFADGGFSTGYVLSNGQIDEYANADTAPLRVALDALRQFIVTGKRATQHTWAEDR